MSQQAGWYPDRETEGQLRYWDGSQWTEYRVTAPSSSPMTSGIAGWPRRHPRWSIVIALIVVLAFISAVTDDAVDEGPVADTPTTVADAEPDAEPSEPEPSPEPTPETTDMPALVGLSLARAESKLDRAGLETATVKKRRSGQRPGTVLRQSSQAGKALELGSRIALVVSAPWPRVPRVVGRGSATGVSRLRSAGFRVIAVQRRVRSGRDGIILKQQPASSRATKPGSTVRIVVADLKVPPPPPPSNCAPGYSPCIPPYPPDLNCSDVGGPITVRGSDPHGLDADGDGVACE